MTEPAKHNRQPDLLEETFVDHRTYSIEDIAEFLGRDYWSIRKVERRGDLKRAIGFGRRVLFFGSEVKRFVRLSRGEAVR